MENIEKSVKKAIHGDVVEGLPEEFSYSRSDIIIDGEHFFTTSIESMTPIERSLIQKKLVMKAFSNILRRPYNIQIRADELSPYYKEELLEAYNSADKQIEMMINDNPHQIDFITKEDIQKYHITQISADNNSVFIKINIKNIHITPKSIGRIHLSDAVIFITTRGEFLFYEETECFGKPCYRPLHHPHISSDSSPCAGGFHADFKKYLRDGNIYLLYGALRAFLVKYNGNSPYWDPHRVLKKTFTYSDEDGNNLDTFEFEGRDRADFENCFWFKDLSSPRYISRKHCIKIFNTIYLKSTKMGWGVHEACSITCLILMALENRLGNPSHEFDNDESYIEYLRNNKQDAIIHLYKKERDIHQTCKDQDRVLSHLMYDNSYFNLALPSNMTVDICDEYRSFMGTAEEYQNMSIREKWSSAFNTIPNDMVHYFTKNERTLKIVKYINDSYNYIVKAISNVGTKTSFYNSSAAAFRQLSWRDLPCADNYTTIKKTAYKNKLKKLDNYMKRIEDLKVLFKRDLYNCAIAHFKNNKERMDKDAKCFNIFSESEMQNINQSITEQQTP